MSARYATKRWALGICDICGQTFKLKTLRVLVVKTKKVNLLACKQCWTPDQPQLRVGMKPVFDPEALRNPRPDINLQESRNIQWGWSPVGFNDVLGLSGLVDMLEARTAVGVVDAGG